jgi:hypothetical protein
MTPIVLSRHIAEAQRRVASRFAINPYGNDELSQALRPLAPQWFEAEPHCSNEPLWMMFVARAIEELAWKSNIPPAWLNTQAAASPVVADAIIQAAAAMLHEFARRENSST